MKRSKVNPLRAKIEDLLAEPEGWIGYEAQPVGWVERSDTHFAFRNVKSFDRLPSPFS